MKVTHLIFKYLFLFTLLLGIVGCEKDIQEMTTTEQDAINLVKTHQKVDVKPFKELLKEPRFAKTFTTIAGASDKNNGQTTVMEDRYGFTIDRTVVKETQLDEEISYTMRITRDSVPDNILENLVVNTNKQGEVTSALLLYYELQSDAVLTVDNSFALDFELTKVKPIEYDASVKLPTVTCITVTVLTCVNDGVGGIGESHLRGAGCIQQNRWTETDLTYCTSSEGGGGDSGWDDDGYIPISSSTSSAGTGTIGRGDSDTTGSTPLSLEESIWRNLSFNLGGSLTTAQMEYLRDASLDTQLHFDQFLRFTDNSPLGIEIISTSIDGLDNYPNVSVDFIDSIFNAVEQGMISDQQASDILNFSSENNWSEEAKEFANWFIDYETLPQTPCGVSHDCVQSIRTMADGLRRLHGEEGILMAEYFESLIGDLDSLTMGDLQIFYDTAKQITRQYNGYMFSSITGAFVEGITPILEIALFEVGGTFAIKMIQKIPLSWVLRGSTRLHKLIGEVGLMGEAGAAGNHIRVVTTNIPVTKAKELFNTLTKNSVSKITEANGAIKANMGNGNFIIFRPASASGGSIPATISIDYRAAGIWTRVRNIKFVYP